MLSKLSTQSIHYLNAHRQIRYFSKYSSQLFSAQSNGCGHHKKRQHNVLFRNSLKSNLAMPVSFSQIRWQSNGTSVTDTSTNIASAVPDGYIPTPPSVIEPDAAQEVVLNALGEPTFASLGLNNYTPTGAAEALLEYLHVSLDLPWIGAIALATLAMRVVIFPLMVMTRRHTMGFNNHMPTFMALQQRYKEATAVRNYNQANELALKMHDYLKNNKVNPMLAMASPMAQVPFFLTMFAAMRGMAGKVDALKDSGYLWFTDLTIVDPFWVLPFVNACVLLLTIELGTDTVKAAALTPTMRWVMRSLPVLVFAVTTQFPAIVCIYWISNSLCSLFQARLLSNKKVADYFKIPEAVDHSKAKKFGVKLPTSTGGSFLDKFRETYQADKKIRELTARQQVAQFNWEKAGKQPVQQTFKHDPTKVPPKKTGYTLD